ncbi:hypothetical protein HY493_05725 [Candidatus Woesearchaeota archaeon]|nr:hypothetical protein [Candidatus Woesearchaeota archaeon]
MIKTPHDLAFAILHFFAKNVEEQGIGKLDLAQAMTWTKDDPTSCTTRIVRPETLSGHEIGAYDLSKSREAYERAIQTKRVIYSGIHGQFGWYLTARSTDKVQAT